MKRSLPDLSRRKEFAKAQAVFTAVIEQFHANGLITDEDLESPDHLWQRIDELVANGLDVEGVVDHRSELARHADKFARDGEHQISLMFYALLFEHTLNAIISRQLERLGKSLRIRKEVIRAVNFDGKVNWLLDLLDLPAINRQHANVMIQVAQQRNSFVHYKWEPMPASSEHKREQSLTLIGAARKAATYLKRYEARLLHAGLKGRIAEMSRLEKPAVWPIPD